MTVQALWDDARGTGHTPSEFDLWGQEVTTQADAVDGKVGHDGTPQVGSLVRVKSINPLVVEHTDDPAAGGASIPKANPSAMVDSFTTGEYYSLGGNHGASVGLTLNQMRGHPFFVSSEQRFDRAGVAVLTAGDEGTVAQLGVYDMEDGMPTTRAADLGDVNVETTGLKEVAIDVTLAAGWYVLATNSNAAVSLRGQNVAIWPIAAAAGSGNQRISWFRNATGIPDPFGTASLFSTAVPAVYLRAADPA